MKAFEKTPPRVVGDIGPGVLFASFVPVIGYVLNRWLDLDLSRWWYAPFVPGVIAFIVADEQQKRSDKRPAMEWHWFGETRAALFEVCNPLARVVAWIIGVILILAVVGLLVIAAVWFYQALSVKAVLVVIAIALVALVLRRRR